MFGSAGGTAADSSTQWYLNKALVPGAWELTQGTPDVVVAVLDTGFDLNHPDLRDSLWVNLGEEEKPHDKDDNDGNGYVDDLHGYDFAGSDCEGDWRPPPAARPPPPSPPPPPRPPPPPPAKRPLAAKRTAATTADRVSAPTAATSVSLLAKVCAPDADVSYEEGDDGHGTHVAGIVAAARNSSVGIAGAAPKVKLMLLKVFDKKGKTFASHIVAAYAYALSNGAHIISCSFGPANPILAPTPYDLDAMRGAAALYGSAVQPLEAKGVLLLAAAGNELTNLNQLASVGSNYLPCTLPNGNVLCVAASNETDRLVTALDARDKPIGSNYGSSVVDLAAPGQDVYNTVPTAQGSYGNKSGTSMATPLVAGVAALVASVVGSAGTLAAPNYYQASRVKALLLQSADALPWLAVRGNRRLNAQRAVEAATASTSGLFLLTPSGAYYSTDGGAASLLAAGLSEEYYAATVGTNSSASSVVAFTNVVLPAAPIDTSVRVPSASSPVTSLVSYRINATAPAFQPSASGALVLRLVGLLRLPAPGTWGVQLAGATPASAVQLAVGQRVIAFGALGASATLVAQAAGLYDFELLVLNPQQRLELLWSTPSTPGAYSAPSADLFFIPSYSPAVHPRYAPNLTLGSAALPAAPPGFHLSWDYATPDPNPERPQQPLPPAFLASFSTGLPPSAGPYAPLRNSVYSPAALYPAPGALAAMALKATLAAAALPNAASGIVAPDLNVSGVYGMAVGHMTPPSTGQLQLQVICSSCRLYVQGAMVIDAAQPLLLGSAAAAASAPRAPITAQSGCLSLAAGATAASPGGAAAYTLELRFLMGDATRDVLSLRWSPCTTPGGAVSPQWGGLGGLMTSSVMWAPPARANLSRGALRCDVWEKLSSADEGAVPSPRDRTPTASFTLPRLGARNQNCPSGSNPACKAVALFSVQDILLTAKVDGPVLGYHVRCWAFFNGTFLRGVFAMRGATQGSSPALATSVYLGNQQILPTTARGDFGYDHPSFAPRVTAAGPYLPLLSFEYPDITQASQYLGVMDGVETLSIRDSMLIDARLIVPAQL